MCEQDNVKGCVCVCVFLSLQVNQLGTRERTMCICHHWCASNRALGTTYGAGVTAASAAIACFSILMKVEREGQARYTMHTLLSLPLQPCTLKCFYVHTKRHSIRTMCTRNMVWILQKKEKKEKKKEALDKHQFSIK